MKAFRPDPPGWVAQLEPAEAVLIAGAMEELATAFEKEAVRDYVSEIIEEGLHEASCVDNDNHIEVCEHSVPNVLGGLDQELPTFQTPPPEADETLNETNTDNDQRQEEKATGKEPKTMRYKASKNRSKSAHQPKIVRDDELLAALDFEPLPPRPEPLNPVVAAILRPMSMDLDIAAELRALTMSQLCQQKRNALLEVCAELRRAAGQGNLARVQPEQVGIWVCALNDLRMSLGWALNITDDERAQEVQNLGLKVSEVSSEEMETVSDYEQGLAQLYTALSWWQETLLSCVTGKDNGL